MNPALVDASYLIAIYNRTDFHHARCMRVHEELEQPMVTCEPVIAESLYMLRSVPGVADAILASIEGGVLEIPFKLNVSTAEIREILEKYADMYADFADACLIRMAEELDTGDILTLDSDFIHYRWKRTRRFNLLIPLD